MQLLLPWFARVRTFAEQENEPYYKDHSAKYTNPLIHVFRILVVLIAERLLWVSSRNYNPDRATVA